MTSWAENVHHRALRAGRSQIDFKEAPAGDAAPTDPPAAPVADTAALRARVAELEAEQAKLLREVARARSGKATGFLPWGPVTRIHGYEHEGMPDQFGMPDQLEVCQAQRRVLLSLEGLLATERQHVHLHGGDTIILGTPGLGRGRVAYQIDSWHAQMKAFRIVRLDVIPGDWESPDG